MNPQVYKKITYQPERDFVPVTMVVSAPFIITVNPTGERTASVNTIADLVARQEKVDKAFLTTMADVSGAIFVPYASNDLLIRISAIKIDSKKAPTVAWSWSTTGVAPYAVGSTAPVPSDMLVADTFLIRSELSVSHELMMYLPGMSGSQAKSITIGREFYFRQRLGTEVTCSNC